MEYSSYEKAAFTITGPLNIQLLKFWLFNSSNFQTDLVKNFMEKLPGVKIDFEIIDNVLPLHQYLWSEISGQWNNGPLNFFEICTEKRFFHRDAVFKLGAVLNMLFHFFFYLIYSVFHETIVKTFIKILSFFSLNFKNSFQDVVYYRKLECLPLWYWNGGPLNIR